MPSFAFHAIDPRGKRLAGRADAPTASALAQMLEGRGLVVVDVGPSTNNLTVKPSEGHRRLNRGALVDVTRALAGLLAAGLSLTRALGAANSVSRGIVSESLTHVRDRVSRGDTLATALAAHPDVFPPFYVGLIRAGEQSGDLPSTFTRLATQLEREEELRSRLVSAAIYPVLLAIVGATAVLVLLLFVLPRFAGVLEGTGARIPRSTQLLISASSVAHQYWFLFLLPPAAIVFATMWVQSSDSGARAWARLVVRSPLVGRLRRDILASRFARTMSVLLTGGAPVLRALDDASASLPDPLAQDEVARVRARVREGASVHLALEDSTLFPPLLAQLVALGEETGKLEEFLRKAADLFEQRTERSMSRIVVLAEPAMIIVLGIVVGSVALSLLQAIYGVNAGSFG